MKDCNTCRYAEWERKSNGTLHPSGDGQCVFPYKIKDLPSAFYWLGKPPKPCGGGINRSYILKDHCSYFNEREG